MKILSLYWKSRGVQCSKKARIGLGVFGGNYPGISISDDVSIGHFFQIICSNSAQLTIGKGTRINRLFTIGAIDDISIGEDCLLSYNVNIHSGTHSFSKDEIPGSGEDSRAPIHIGDRCFIGCGAVILKGVTLGDNCVVGANAVVTKSFPSGSVIGGNPAILLKKL